MHLFYFIHALFKIAFVFLLFILQKFRSAHTAAKTESGIEILTKQEAKVSFQSNNLMS